ncbi:MULTISPECIES: DUF4434 domain-containing protein [unclassified Mucilaginibacter]|uniref:DUF4434 domain-containing protein n=1 Tax=unclassified Mucilaginibacter TaxID=2617802 RepID=UPI002AC943A4|nr:MULTISPECIES: DUF4434 domain-containing protein [unclassified Mucilaginibacter]MEB0263272.1 DUF4434 domain-containing protein [Mucilaginibacter sp. 10I4]MEB0278240.1 DUF4434 domain-containing protein [Mucilaginibacter sp. 10B2]MEB0300974.1 DUF4434 domain-containing protein [Mucilaginibacter sp. 5C4]WPX23885.1 DUF4434 domain-containing protein [Mucilaginibacter sp. 5C4]
MNAYKLAIRVVLFLVVSSTFAFATPPGTAKPEISLTLIPPSPVTDQVTLDVRAGIWNNTTAKKTIYVLFYLDKVAKGNLLHQQTLILAAKSNGCVKFPWSTRNMAGNHKIILVTKSGKKVLCKERPMQVLASNIRSTRRVDGAWLGFYHWSEAEGKFWNPELKKATDEQWGEMMTAQHALEMNIIVIQDVVRNPTEYAGKHNIEKDGYKGVPYYPSNLFPGHVPIAAVDPLEAVLAAADKNGMNVFIGVGSYAWFDFTNGSLEWHKKVADELWEKYGHHDSFYGWYVSEEQDGGLGDAQARKDIVHFFKEFKAYVNKIAPDKPVMLATNSHNVGSAIDTYRKLLPNLDILCPFGFHRMPSTDFTGEQSANKLQELCNEAGSHLWMDMEVFDFADGNALVPRPIKGLLSDLHRFPNFEKIICYQFTGLLNSPTSSIKPGGPNTVKLYLDYKQYLDSITTPLQNLKGGTGIPINK